jgi:hypothetical protein
MRLQLRSFARPRCGIGEQRFTERFLSEIAFRFWLSVILSRDYRFRVSVRKVESRSATLLE